MVTLTFSKPNGLNWEYTRLDRLYHCLFICYTKHIIWVVLTSDFFFSNNTWFLILLFKWNFLYSTGDSKHNHWCILEVVRTFSMETYVISKVYFWDNSEWQRNVYSNYWIRKIVHLRLTLGNGHDACMSNASRPFSSYFVTMSIWTRLIGQRFNLIYCANNKNR